MNRIYLRATLCATAVLVSSQVLAQGAELEEIIVTARRVEERLQDVPISMSVVDQDRLTRSNIVSSEDLARVVPGLNMQSRYSSEQSSFAIRGFSSELRTSASVGAYFGEVVAPRGGGISLNGGDGAGPGSLFDLQNVQVLKGPQGTLFGRNTTGGAVLLTPVKPTGSFEGYGEASYGNYDMQRLQAVVNLPVAEWARLRIGADHQTRDGYQHNVSGIGPREFSDVDYLALRASLVLDLTPNLENYTIVSYLHSDNNGQITQVFRANPNAGFGSQAVPAVNRLNASNDPYQIEQKLINPRSLTKQFQTINTTTWTATDTLTIKNIASYSTFIQDLRQDIFATNFLIPSVNSYISTAFSFNPDGFHTNDQKNLTEELQFQGNAADGRLIYQFGAYYEHSQPHGRTASAAPSTGAICLISGFTTIENSRCTRLDPRPQGLGRATPNSGTIEFINEALYAQSTYALTDQLKLTGGVRYTYDRAKGEAQGFADVYNAPIGTFVGPTVAGCSTGYPTATNCVFSAETSDKKPTWTTTLAYNPIQDLMVYGTYSRGYRQGSVTPFSPAGVPVFGPEKVDNFEVGTKLSFNGAVSGNLNFASFYSKLNDQQLQIGLQDSTGVNPSATSILNAGKSRMYGVEFDGSLLFSKLFRLDASATYLDTKLEEITAPSFPGYDVVNPTALKGDPLPYTPDWSTNLGGTFILPVSESVGTIELGAVYRYTSSYTSAASAVTSFKSTPVKQVDLNLNWSNIFGKPVDLSFYGTNMTDQFTQGVILPLFNSFGFDARYVGPPRMYGARVRVRFGATD